ncbi:hypothetical protein EDD11_008840, partial [Mortierella claussenii]
MAATTESSSSASEATVGFTPSSAFPSTLAMALENPTSASLVLPGITHISPNRPHHGDNHSLHQKASTSKAPSIISEKYKPSKDDQDHPCTKTEDSVQDIETQEPHDKLLDYPEGGFGWLVVMSAFVINFWAFGPGVSFGVYQAYFLDQQTFPGAMPTDISWVGSIGAASMFIPGPFVAPMTRYLGVRLVVFIGIVIESLGFIIASFATQLWHLYLTQGFMFGVGGGLVFFSSVSVTAQYFDKKRGLANGIAVAGSGIGGLAVAPLTRLLIARVGVQWCQRIVGFAIFGFMTAVFVFIRPRVRTIKKGPILDLAIFRVPGFLYLLITGFIVTFGYMVPIFLIPTYSSQVLNQTPSTGANLISLFSGINAASRVILGVAADRLGRTNTLFTCCFMSGLACFAIWSVATNITILTAFMAVYGLFGGGFISIFPVAVAQVVGVERLPSALGIVYFGNIV